jgi:pyrimidine operon attenuation protein/uracil phosphoribosyltransferase
LGFFRVSFRVYVGFLIGISLGGLWVSSRVSFRIQTGENKEKKKQVDVERHRSTEAGKAKSGQSREAEKREARTAEKQEKTEK